MHFSVVQRILGILLMVFGLSMLPPVWQTVTLFNPVVYLISGFRWSFYGIADVGVVVSVFMKLCATFRDNWPMAAIFCECRVRRSLSAKASPQVGSATQASELNRRLLRWLAPSSPWRYVGWVQ